MTEHETLQLPNLQDDVLKIYDPTGTIGEIPQDRVMMSWLRTAYYVNEALKADPANKYLVPGLQVIDEAIRQRTLEMQHARLYPPNDGLR